MRVREDNFEKSTRTENSCQNGSSKEIVWLQGSAQENQNSTIIKNIQQ
jgi:hypothetical protein